MEENGGFATLGHLYQEVPKIKECEWKTKTLFASIRRIVQDERFFFKIRPGLWALKSYKNKLPAELIPQKASVKGREEFNHSYYQGLLLEIGKLKRFETFVPNQDKNKLFLGKKLGEIATLNEIYPFTYEHILQKAKTIDVSWFNPRKMPHWLFEVEHSTDIHNSLLKFSELQDFYVKFFIVAPSAREREYRDRIGFHVFGPIQKRTSFMSYEGVSSWHAKTFELSSIEKGFGF